MWGLLTGIWPKLLAGGAAALAAIGGLAMVRRSGVQAQQNADLKQEAKDDATASAARIDVDQNDAAAVARRMRDWERR